MTECLRLTIPLRPGQDLMSYLAHLALRNGLKRSLDFCRDLGIDHAALARGEPEQVAVLATLSGVPESVLQAEAVRTGKGVSTFRGHPLGLPPASLVRQAVCPGCLRDDAANSGLPFNRSAYIRTVWRLPAIRTCSRHGMTVGTHFGEENLSWRDPIVFLAAAADRLDAVLEVAPRREASPLELYLLGRIDGVTDAVPFLDRLGIHVVTRFCEALGLVQDEGLETDHGTMESRLHAAGALGFQVAAGGEDAVTSLLVELQNRPHYAISGNVGPGMAFGELYTLLSATIRNPAYSEVRDFLRRHVEATVPFVSGRSFLGEPLRDGAVQSVRTASLTSGVHPKRLRKILVGLGHVEDGAASRTDHRTIFATVDAAPLLSNLSEAMSIREAAAYLGIKRVAFHKLYEYGCPTSAPVGQNEGLHERRMAGSS